MDPDVTWRMLCATLGATPERARTVMFTMPYSAFRMMIMAKKDSPIAKIEDLAGKRVGVPRGTPQEQAVKSLFKREFPLLDLGKLRAGSQV